MKSGAYERAGFRSSWIRQPLPNPAARLRLFCFPYAGGGTTVFRGWAPALSPYAEVNLIQFPGRENRLIERAITNMQDVLVALMAEVAPLLDRPAAFFGHSMGALVAFELARRLQHLGYRAPALLIVSGRPAPQLSDTHRPIHDLPDAEFITKLTRYNGVPQAVLENAELMELLLPVLRADFALCETYKYVPESSLCCPIVAFAGRADPTVKIDAVTPWRDQTGEDFMLEHFPGDHFFIHSARDQVLHTLSVLLRNTPTGFGDSWMSRASQQT